MLGAAKTLRAGRFDIIQFEYNSCWIEYRRFLKDAFELAKGLPYTIARVTSSGLEVYENWHPELERFIEANYVLVHDRFLHAIPFWKAAFDGSNSLRRH